MQNIEIMKKLSIISSLIILFSTQVVLAQMQKKTNSLPLVDPITQCALRYYYYPNIEAYFDTQKKVFHLKVDGEWTTAEEIPYDYGGYSVYKMINVSITDYDDENPSQFISIHRKKYPYTANGRIKPSMVSTE